MRVTTDKVRRVVFSASWGNAPDTADLLRAAADHLDELEEYEAVDVVLGTDNKSRNTLTLFYVPGDDDED